MGRRGVVDHVVVPRHAGLLVLLDAVDDQLELVGEVVVHDAVVRAA